MQVLQGGMTGKPVHVLVADDDPVMRALVRANLEGRVDTLSEAADGQQAWDMLLGANFDLALIDLSMPGIDGFALIRCIRSHPRTRHLPVVVITSSTDQSAVRGALEAGATSFLTKPVNWTLFAHQIDYLVRLNQGSSAERTHKQRAEAVARAKDAVIVALAARVREQTRRLVGASELAMMRSPAGNAAGLDYAAVGPEHAWLRATGRAEYAWADDRAALEAFHALARLEGIMPALESAHAVAHLSTLGPALGPGAVIVVNLSGRGDKDVHTVAQLAGDRT